LFTFLFQSDIPHRKEEEGKSFNFSSTHSMFTFLVGNCEDQGKRTKGERNGKEKSGKGNEGKLRKGRK
jgi:hypothetical protein